MATNGHICVLKTPVTYIGIDPGTDHSGFTALYPNGPKHTGVFKNTELLDHCERVLLECDQKGLGVRVGIEMIACYGMPVGREVFETCLWIGKFVARFPRVAGQVEIRKVYRREVKHHLCNSAKANDANIRRALIDLYPPTGGGAVPQIGTKAKPGPLYGFKSHAWAALGVAKTAEANWHILETFLQSQPTTTAYL